MKSFEGGERKSRPGKWWAKVLSHAAMSYKQYSTGWKILSFPAEFFYGAERSMTCSKKKNKNKKAKLTSVPNLCEVNPWTPQNTFIAE